MSEEQEIIEELKNLLKEMSIDKYPAITRATYIRWEPEKKDLTDE